MMMTTEPPRDLDAEQAVLAAVFARPAVLDELTGYLRHEHFSDGAYAQIYAAMVALYGDNEPLTPLTVGDALRRRDQYAAAGGAATLQLLSAMPDAQLHVEHAGRIVERLAVLRGLGEASQAIAVVGSNPSLEPDEALAQAHAALDRAEAVQVSRRGPTKAERFATLLSSLRQPLNLSSARIMTRLDAIDDLTRGLRRGHLVVLGAYSSVGKSSFATTVAHTAARTGHGTVIASYEMTAEEMDQKLLSLESGIGYETIDLHHCAELELKRLERATAELVQSPLDVIITTGWAIEDLCTELRRRKREGPLDFVIVDYLQLVRTRQRCDTREQELRVVTERLKELAVELDVVVLALCQLNRESVRASEPSMSHLRESGSIENTANVVILLWRDEDPSPGAAVIRTRFKVDKARTGKRGSGTIGLIGKTMQFVSMATGDGRPMSAAAYAGQEANDDEAI